MGVANDPKDLIWNAMLLGTPALIKAANREIDPLGTQKAARDAKAAEEEQARKQGQAAAAQAEAIRTAPRKLEPEGAPADALRRYRVGFGTTIRTSGLGLTGPASTAAASLKGKLGQ